MSRKQQLTSGEERPSKRAAIYLRVSTTEQGRRGGEPEGYSIPAQRDACRRRAAEFGAEIVAEYIDMESGTTTSRRHFRRLLKRINEKKDLDYVVVWKVSRWARTEEAINLKYTIMRPAGAQLLSATEHIDDTPHGRFNETIMYAVSTLESDQIGQNVIAGSTKKAELGGTPKRAPLGYLNVPIMEGAREGHTVILDPERHELIALAFQAYASGDYSLQSLLDELTAKGLTTRPTRTYPAHPLHLSNLSWILKNPYYMGIVQYRGIDYELTPAPAPTARGLAKLCRLRQTRHRGRSRTAVVEGWRRYRQPAIAVHTLSSIQVAGRSTRPPGSRFLSSAESAQGSVLGLAVCRRTSDYRGVPRRSPDVFLDHGTDSRGPAAPL